MRYVIIGTSAAGLAAAETIRQRDRQGGITLISDEPHLPYSRPLLTYLLGREVDAEKIFLKSHDYFDRWGFEPRLGAPVLKVKPESREVHLEGGETVLYDKLLIASGASPRLLGIPGEDLAGVYTLRNLADVENLEKGLPPGGSVAIVGAGAVGLKAAEALIRRGNRVTLLEAESRPLPHLLDQTAAGLLHQVLTSLGVESHFGVRPVGLMEKKGRLNGLLLDNDNTVTADAVIIAVGVRPRNEFLAGTGLDRPEGIPVSPFMETGHRHIFAAGDCACAPHFLTGEPAAYRIWPAAVAQGEIAGANMTGAGRRYDGILPRNSISLKGVKIIAGGLLEPDGKDGEVFNELDRSRGHYRRLVFQNGCLVGVTLAGPKAADAGIYFQIMARKVPVKDLPVDIRSAAFHPGKLWA
ncbi:MAG: FAD-dependent oxidoreductase [Deltaproteobacteria bacterium]|nr:FAD-dependent oxidoreductase [Deltaproteobacteria bacterium]